MATNRRVGKRAAKPDVEPDDNGGEDSSDIDAVLEALTGEAEHVVLWRVDGPKGKPEHVDKVALSRFGAEYVTERHGGGDYVFRVYGKVKEGGGRNVLKYKEFSIDKSIAPKSGSALLEWQRVNGVKPGTAVAAPAAPSNERSPWLDVALATLPSVAAGVIALLGKEKTTDPVLMALLNKMVSSDNGKGIDPVELQRLIADERERAYNHGRESAPRGGGDEDGTARVLESTLPGLVDIFKESVRNDRAKVDAMRQTRTATARVSQTSSASADTTDAPAWLKLVKENIPQLIAGSGMIDAPSMATRILENMTVKMARELAASCEAETFVADTLAELPELTATPERRAYFTVVLTAVQDELAPNDPPEAEGAGDGQGDGTAAASDE